MYLWSQALPKYMRETKKRSKAPVVLGQRASSSLRIPCFTATLQGDRLYNVKWVHLDPNPDPVIRELAAGQNPLLEMQLCKDKRPRWWEEGRWRGYQQAMCPPFHSPPPPRKKPVYVYVCVCDVHVWINARTCTLTRLLPAFCRLCSHDQVSRISSAARPGKPKSRPTQHNKTFPPQFYSTTRREAVKMSKTRSMVLPYFIIQTFSLQTRILA